MGCGASTRAPTPLHEACGKGDVEKVKELLAVSSDGLNELSLGGDCEGDSPLMMAAKGGHSDCVRVLLSAPGIEVNQQSAKLGRTALDGAAANGHEACFRALLAAEGIDVNLKAVSGRAPIHMAVDHEVCLKLLLEVKGIDVNPQITEHGGHPLAMTVAHNEDNDTLSCMKMLLEHPTIQPNLQYQNGNSALFACALAGCDEKVKLLLAKEGIAVNQLAIKGMTPLIAAVVSGLAAPGGENCVKMLLAAPGVDVNIADVNGGTPLHYASMYGRASCVKILLAAKGIDVNKKAEIPLGATALDLNSTVAGDATAMAEIQKLLIDAGAREGDAAAKAEVQKLMIAAGAQGQLK